VSEASNARARLDAARIAGFDDQLAQLARRAHDAEARAGALGRVMLAQQEAIVALQVALRDAIQREATTSEPAAVPSHARRVLRRRNG
jgi:hypothetical protein